MQIIPVIDLRGGMAVHAVAGERHHYLPIRGPGMRQGDIADLARFYAARKPDAIYVADLDSIGGGNAQVAAWEAISQVTSCPLWIDYGVREKSAIAPYLDFQSLSILNHRMIVASETVRDVEIIPWIVRNLGAESLILSLDRRENTPLAHSAIDERVFLSTAAEAGVRQVIALDLATVGVGRAVETLDSWQPLLVEFPCFQWFLGGGVRDAKDLALAKCSGFQGVLSATAILQGAL